MNKQIVNWVIDENIIQVHPELTAKMPQVIRDLGHNCYLTKYVPFSDEQDYGPYTGKDIVVLYGTHGFIRKCNKGFIPGAFGVNNNAKYSTYAQEIPQEFLLNKDYILITWGEFKRRSDWFYKLLGTDHLFIRPNSGFKTFTGDVFSKSNLNNKIKEKISFSSVIDETLIVVSKAQWIQSEFRFIVVDNQVVTASEYRWDGILDIRRDWPDECYNLAEKIAKLPWQLDSAYTCDIAVTANGPKVIELNSFSCAGLYACDLYKVVSYVSELAIKEYNEYWK